MPREGGSRVGSPELVGAREGGRVRAVEAGVRGGASDCEGSVKATGPGNEAAVAELEDGARRERICATAC